MDSSLPTTLFAGVAKPGTGWMPPSLSVLQQEFADFTLLELIGRGGMGAVYKALQPALQRHVAIKILPLELGADETFAQRFRREAQLMASLDHEHIVPVHVIGQTPAGYLYFVMPFVAGDTLAAVMRSKSASIGQILDALIQVSQGLECAHSTGIVHRDVKPGNILIDARGVAKLADFGLALPSKDSERLTSSGLLLGTLDYMAPEQHRDSQVDGRADIYALGVILYEALTGKLPQGNWPSPSSISGCDRRFDAVVARCLQQEPAHRYQSVGEFRDALLAIGCCSPEDLVQRTSRVTGATPAALHQRRIAVLLFTDIVNSVDLQAKIGTEDYISLLATHDEIFRRAVGNREGGRILQHTGDGFLAVFDSASSAVNAALRFQRAISATGAFASAGLKVRAGVHQGEIIEEVATGGGPSAGAVGMAVNMAARVMSLALPGQILLTRAVCDDARLYVREHPPSDDGRQPPALKWLACGRYVFKGVDEPVEVFEVGGEGIAPSQAPPDSEKAKRHVDADEADTLGWRPSVDQEIPGRPGWKLKGKLGAGGFGEAWLAQHHRTREERVFKFCFDADRLRSFKREEKLFVLLKATLGERPDIATVYETQRDRSPYFVESRYFPEGNLMQWAEKHGGLEAIPLQTRLDFFALTAKAAAAAHSVGIIHKDIKPTNVLVRIDEQGKPRPVLADFGIGVLADMSAAEKLGLTADGLAGTILGDNASSRTGTRLYTAPEYLTGSPASVQGDIYALGVMLYQLVLGDANRALAQGWERRVPDLFLRDDISAAVDGDENMRLADAAELAKRVETLDSRREAALSDEQKQRRAAQVAAMRRKIVLLSAGAGILVLLAGAGFALWRRAETARDAEAKARLEEAAARRNAEEITRLTLSEIREQLRLAGRPDILEKAEAAAAKWLETLAASDNPDALRLAGASARQLGELAEMRGAPTEAAKLYERAIAIGRRLVSEQGSRPEDRRSLGKALAAEAARRTVATGADRDAANVLNEEALKLSDTLLAEHSDDTEAKSLRAAALAGIGYYHRTKLQLKEARARLEEAATLGKELTNAEPHNLGQWRNFQLTLLRLAEVQRLSGDLAAAEAALRDRLKTFEELERRQPESRLWPQDTATVLDVLGSLLLRDAGRPADAEPLLRRCLDKWQGLAKEFPKDFRILRGVAAAQEKLGEICLVAGRLDEAAPLIQAALTAAESAAPDPAKASGISQLRDLCITNLQNGRLLMARSDAAGALPFFEKGAKVAELILTNPAGGSEPYSKLYQAEAQWRLGQCEVALSSTAPPNATAAKARIAEALRLLREVKSAVSFLPPDRVKMEQLMEADLK